MKIFEMLESMALLICTFLAISLCDENIVGAFGAVTVAIILAVIGVEAGCWHNDD